MSKITETEKLEIIRLYSEERVSLSTLSKQFHHGAETIKKVLTDNGIKIRSHRESRKKYDYDETYFSKIDTPEKAYWLGFIYADGYISKKQNGNPIFGMTLAEEEPLIKLNQCLKSTKPIRSYKKTNSYSDKSIEYKSVFCSSQMVEDLEKVGCVENKTFKLEFPYFLDENLISHFIRGYFDGDGSVYQHLQKNGGKEYLFLGVSICGTESFLKSLAPYIEGETCVYKDKRKDTDCWVIRFNSNIRCLKFYHYIYKNCGNMYLSRKKEKFEDYIKDRGSTTTISNPIYGDSEYKKLCYIED